MAYPDPDALTRIADGYSIATYSYDAEAPLSSILRGSNVTSDSSMNVAQWFDYAPYGSVLATTNTGQALAARGYIGQFSDSDGLSYLNARYYSSGQGQFTTQDPVFLGSQQNLGDPQSLNSYSYANDNPIVKSDPSGQFSPALILPALLFPEFSIPADLLLYGGAAVAGIVGGQYLDRQSGGGGGYDDASMYQATKGVSGQGYDDTPKLGPKPPRGPLGLLIFSTIATAYGIHGLSDYLEPLLKPDNGLQPLKLNGTNSFFSGTSPIFSLPFIANTIKTKSTIYLDSSGQPASAAGGGSAQSGGSSGGYVISNGQTPVNNGKGAPSYCLGVCKQ
jgi:RHS repeat-associated protein